MGNKKVIKKPVVPVSTKDGIQTEKAAELDTGGGAGVDETPVAESLAEAPVVELPEGIHVLDRGVVPALSGRMLNPGDRFSEDELTSGRFKELKGKGLIRGMMTTEEKGTITK